MQFGLVSNDGSVYLDSIEINNNSYGNVTYGNVTYTLGNCSDFSTKSKEYHFIDETTEKNMTANLDGTITYINQAGDQTYTTDINNSENFIFCVSPSYAEITADIDFTYSSTNGSEYPQRRYYVGDVVFSNASTSTNLYLLNESEGIYFYVKVVDAYSTPISSALVTLQISVGGTPTTVFTGLTDGSGLVKIFVDGDSTHTLTVTKTGYTTYTTSLVPTGIDIYTVTLPQSSTTNYSYATGVSFNFDPDETLSNSTTYNFTINVTSSYWLLTGCTFYVYNQTHLLSSIGGTYNITNCNAQIDYHVANQTYLYTQVNYEINDTNFTYKYIYDIKHTYKGNASLAVFIDDLTAFGQSGFDDFTRIMITFLIIVLVIIMINLKVGYLSIRNSLIIIFLFTVFFSYVGWLTINVSAIPTVWAKKYLISMLFGLFVIGNIIKTGGVNE
jgi:hypothetical protein